MNVYDFDKTIFLKDSSTEFYLFALRKRPRVIKTWPGQIAGVLRYALGKSDRDAAKTAVMSYFGALDDPESLIEKFWEDNFRYIAPWYKEVQREDDLVITASPLQIAGPACKRLGIKNVIACAMDTATGALLEPNTKGEGKVKKFRELYGDAQIDKFYSDSLADLPLAKLAKESFLVKKGVPEQWQL